MRTEVQILTSDALVAAMRDSNLSLCCSHERGDRWWLSDGRNVPPSIARSAVSSHDIVGVGDTLFTATLSQTFRYSRGG